MDSTSWPRVAVVGAGAVGGYFGGMLARAGAHVTLIGRPSHVDVWKRDGLALDSIHFQERISVEASTDIAASADAELVLFSVKSYDTEETARQLFRHVGSDALIVSLQNGVDNVERIRAAAALDPIAAVVYVASSMPAPGRVTHAGRGDSSSETSRGAQAPHVTQRSLAWRNGSRRRVFHVASLSISTPISGRS